MWRLLQKSIPEPLRAELETRIGGALGDPRGSPRSAEIELDGFFAASRGAGALLRQLLDQPDTRALIGERLRDPVVFKACPTIKPAGAPASNYRTDAGEWARIDDPPSLFTLWFAITEAGVGNGCLRMGTTSAEGERTMASVSRLSNLELASTTAPSYDAAMKPGQVLFFDSSQLYGAYPNHSQRPRVAVKAVLGERASIKARDAHEIGDYGSVGLVAKQGWRKLFGFKG
ncbi:MAG TPA: phytanoyl-CoA dioxygenase family protein [Novosphingobium sp.]|nr:phytanoyl-CoA dioxygenase family protein [Novosphingobium sp.]